MDHTDYYKNMDDMILAYQEFANKADKMVIACGDDPYTHMLEVNPQIYYYGLNDDKIQMVHFDRDSSYKVHSDDELTFTPEDIEAFKERLKGIIEEEIHYFLIICQFGLRDSIPL